MSRVLELAKASTKLSYQRMMDAATKTANLFTLCAEEEQKPEKAGEYRRAAQQWQNTAATAAQHWRTF